MYLYALYSPYLNQLIRYIMEAATIIQSVWRSYRTRRRLFTIVPLMRRAIADKRTDISHLTGVDRMLYDVVWTYVRRRHHHPLTRVKSDSPRVCSLCKERGNICWTCEECVHTLCEPCFYIRYL